MGGKPPLRQSVVRARTEKVVDLAQFVLELSGYAVVIWWPTAAVRVSRQ
jgi:hypothetical protein